jgi:lysophospholipase L1-like esterase
MAQGAAAQDPGANSMQKDGKAARPVVILGASYAGSWQPGPIAGRPVINRGVQGQQSFEFLERFERDVVAAQPSAVIIWGFINDIFRTAPEQIEPALARIRGSYEQMVKLARANGIEPILATEVTIAPVDTWSEYFASWVGWVLRKESHDARINRHVMATNDWLRSYAAREGLLLLDLQPVLSEPNGRRKREFAKEDGSHLPPAGYEALTTAVKPVLEKHFSARADAR